MTSAIRTTRNSRTKIFAACPAKIFAAGSNAGKNPCGWLRISQKRNASLPGSLEFVSQTQGAPPHRSVRQVQSAATQPASPWSGLATLDARPKTRHRRGLSARAQRGISLRLQPNRTPCATARPALFGDMLR